MNATVPEPAPLPLDMREGVAPVKDRMTTTLFLAALFHGIVILGVHFDDSQMFSLLGDIRAHSGYRKVPILCVLGSRGRAITDIAVEGLDHAVKAMRANGFLDLEHFPDDQESNARVCRIVDYLILIDGDLQHIARTTGESLGLVDRRRLGGQA